MTQLDIIIPTYVRASPNILTVVPEDLWVDIVMNYYSDFEVAHSGRVVAAAYSDPFVVETMSRNLLPAPRARLPFWPNLRHVLAYPRWGGGILRQYVQIIRNFHTKRPVHQRTI